VIERCKTRCWSAALALLLCACNPENYGLDYSELSVSARRADGAPAALLEEPLCVRLPVLIGSIVQEESPIEGSLGVDVRATAHEVDVRFTGALGGNMHDRTLSIERLEGYSETIEVTTVERQVLTVVLSSACPATGGVRDSGLR
jgi:hypothetical protein